VTVLADSPPVGLLCDYFAAPNDVIAAATIDWPGGPARPGKALASSCA
jgi:hypothetical protein